jgi:hypothetical protein
VGERAIALCARADGQFDVFYSHWGAAPGKIGRLLDAGSDGLVALAAAEWEWRRRAPLGRVVESLDYLSTEAVYVLSPGGVGVFLSVWLGVDRVAAAGASFPPEFGTLCRVRSVAGAARVRTGTRWLKEAVARGVETGAVSPTVAVRLLVLFLLPAPACYPPAVAAFLEGRAGPAFADAGGP